MTILENIKEICAKKKISIKQLEAALGYGNGSLSKANSIKAERAAQIAQYLDVPLEWLYWGEPEAEQMPIEQSRLIAQNMNNARELEKDKIKNAIDFYTDPTTAEMMQKLFESPGRRALFNAVADMDEESIQKYADFIERITHDNNQSN